MGVMGIMADWMAQDFSRRTKRQRTGAVQDAARGSGTPRVTGRRAAVRVETLLTAADDPLVAAIERLAKPRPHLPADYALNHGHYLSGEPKKWPRSLPTRFISSPCWIRGKRFTNRRRR